MRSMSSAPKLQSESTSSATTREVEPQAIKLDYEPPELEDMGLVAEVTQAGDGPLGSDVSYS